MDLGLERWTDFNVALVGATAALAGLVIVAASVNVAEIVKSSSLTARLAAAIANLMVALTGAAIGLMPDVAGHGYGITLVLLAGSSGPATPSGTGAAGRDDSSDEPNHLQETSA